MKKLSGIGILVYVVVAMVVAAVVVGFYLTGSPSTERERQFDNQRVNELQSISSSVDFYYQQHGVLPDSLNILVVGGQIMSMNDPKTGELYVYQIIGDNTYNLCATFDLVTPEDKNTAPMRAEPIPFPAGTRNWNHPAGNFCFELDAKDVAPYITCGLRNPCAAGQNCVVLPNTVGAFCVPAGKECLAAACPGECTIAESYPAQVNCE